MATFRFKKKNFFLIRYPLIEISSLWRATNAENRETGQETQRT